MAKKARRNSTSQGFAGMTMAQFFHNYVRPDKSNKADYASLRHSFHEAAKPAPEGMVRIQLTRNQRRLAKKLGIELKEAE
ncbi:TPA: hypothetical protein KIU63_004911 [Citrobacter koseri]|nr:hypothetical protein [Citrobacter koseri]HBD3039978.1 hypothetical protein [Citrobacter koseri]HBD3191017.1 hypothetical protein [Citrobacter koseri]HBD3276986.1 hypothetical protein [Citrobacter koseri]